MHRRVAAAGAALCLGLTGAPAGAQTRPLRWDPALDVRVTVGGAAADIAAEAFKGVLAPSHCHWCDADSVDVEVREALVWRDTAAADTISNVGAFALMPLASVGLEALAATHEGARGNVTEDTLLVAEAFVVAADMTQLTKMLFGRERPFVHALPPDQKALTDRPSDNNLSFFSGHASGVFALAAASGTVATMRGYRWAPLVWSVGGAVAATTAYLRIAADKHWLTDVVVGAVVGAGIGFGVPFLFHSPAEESPQRSASAALQAQALPAGSLIAIAW